MRKSTQPSQRSIARRLLALVRASSPRRSSHLLRGLLERAERSARFADATFAAVQRLRDRGALFDEEATFLFASLFEARADVISANDAELQRATDAWAMELIGRSPRSRDDAWHQRRVLDRLTVLRAEFFASHGELTLGERVITDASGVGAEQRDGETLLIAGKCASPTVGAVDRAWVALVAERLLAVGAATDDAEASLARERFDAVLTQCDPRSAATAIRELHEIGAIGCTERFALVEAIVERLVDDAARSDRRLRCLAVRANRMAVASIEAAAVRRRAQLRVIYLRRLGQHGMADAALHA